MKAILFPGQGSQIVGMGSEFYNNFDNVKDIFKEADEKLKFKISDLILKGPETSLRLTENTQPAILTVSYAIYQILIKEFNFNIKNIKYFAGHSLGEYTALVSSESLTFSDAAYLLHERGKSMQEAVPEGKGSMLAVMGLKIEEIEKYIKDLGVQKGVCEIANDNSDNQVILSGDKSAIDEINKVLKNNKKKSIFLPVSAPFHCSLMNPAAKIMKEKINQTSFNDPLVELVSNVTAEPVREPDKIKSLLVRQIFSKVRWRESILFMINNGVNEFIEIGPGKVLSGLVKRISDKVLSKSINTIEDIKSLK